MKNRTMPAIDIELQPSMLLMAALLVISMLACLCVIIVAIPFGIKLCLLIGIVFSSVYYMLRDALLALPASWQRLEVSSVGELRLTSRQGQHCKPALGASSFIHPQLVIINTKKAVDQNWFRLAPAPVLVFPHATNQHRQLRVWLRWWQHV